MLTRVENFSITLVPHFLSKRGHVRIDIGKGYWEWRDWRLTEEEFDQFLVERQIMPFRFQLDYKIYWLFEDKLYKDSEGLTPEDVKALLITRKKQKQSLNHLHLHDTPQLVEGKDYAQLFPMM